MEKIININLGGRLIAIEDAAYTSLKIYLESLHRYFAAEEGRDEIINDIESRLAELMEERLKHGSSAITNADVQEIVAGMGSVEDFAAEEGAPAESIARAAAPRTGSSRRFYRDANDKVAGGVCAGLASYLNVDPALIRVVFAILALGGWGTGILLYIVLWIFVPAQPIESFRGRRLFRSEDDKWIGGVASGIATYFDKETWVFRLAFAAPFILSVISGGGWHLLPHSSIFFGSFSGTFVLIYIVLWVVLPVARTQFEKMEMRGEKVDLNTIRQNVAANMGDIKGRMKEFGGEVSKSATQFMNTRGKEFGREAAMAAGNIASRGGHVVGTIIKAFFFFIGASIAFSLFMALIGYSFGGFSGLVNDFILQKTELRALGWATIILCFGIPLVALVTFIARRALRIHGGSRYVSLGFTALWISGLVCAAFLIAAIANVFHRSEQIREEVAIAQPKGGRLLLDVPQPGIEYSNSLTWLHGDIHGWDIAGDVMNSAAVGVTTRRSPDSQYHVFITRYSGGRTSAEAKARALKISYAARNAPAGDSMLLLDNGFIVTKNEGYRGQNVEVEIQVPVGRKIRFNENVADKLSANRIMRRHYYRHGHNRYARWNLDEAEDFQDWDPDIDYVMAADGRLLDPLHPAEIENSVAKAASDDDEDDSEETSARPACNRRGVSYRIDSLNRAMDAIQRQKERKMDSLDRARERLVRQREALQR